MRHTAPRQSADQLWKSLICKAPREFLTTGSSTVFLPVRASRTRTPILTQAYPRLPAGNQYFFYPTSNLCVQFRLITQKPPRSAPHAEHLCLH